LWVFNLVLAVYQYCSRVFQFQSTSISINEQKAQAIRDPESLPKSAISNDLNTPNCHYEFSYFWKFDTRVRHRRRGSCQHAEAILGDGKGCGIKSCERYEDAFNENVRFNGKRYETVLPWNDVPQLPSDFELCSKRLKSLQRRLLNQPELLCDYYEIIQAKKELELSSRFPTPIHIPSRIAISITCHITLSFDPTTMRPNYVLFTTVPPKHPIVNIL
jgi:hypothetical protein